jgi:hypothetical protein
MPERVGAAARRLFGAAVLVAAVGLVTFVIVTLAGLEHRVALQRPEARHREESDPEARTAGHLAARFATVLFVVTQRSLLIAPAGAFAIGGAWLVFSNTFRSTDEQPRMNTG